VGRSRTSPCKPFLFFHAFFHIYRFGHNCGQLVGREFQQTLCSEAQRELTLILAYQLTYPRPYLSLEGEKYERTDFQGRMINK
jgi:hypothetical protein